MTGPDLLRAGIFTAPEAAALIGVPEQKIRAWVVGWPRTEGPPMIHNDLGWVDGRLAFSFANLMELRFVAFFAGAGVKIRKIRAIMHEARAELHGPHPFATNIVFKTDGVNIVAETVRKNGVRDLYDLHSGNFEMADIVYQSLKDDVIFDPKGDARAWFPRPVTAPNVIIHPAVAFGRPVLRAPGIPTETVADAFVAEGEDVEAVAILFDISKRHVKEAVAFENSLRRAA